VVENQPDEMPLRILLSAYTISPTRGSEPGFAWRLAEGLARAGHQVTVLTTSRYADEQELDPRLGGRLRILAVDPTKRRYWRGQAGVYFEYIAWQRESLTAAQHLIAESDRPFDVVHHFTWGSLFWGSPLWRLEIPFVFGPIGGGSTSPKPLRGLYAPKDRMRELLRAGLTRAMTANRRARRTISHAAVTLAANSDTARVIASLGGSGRLLLPDTTPGDWLAAPVIDRSTPGTRVVWVGRAMARKGLPLAIWTIAALPDHFRLRIVGDGPCLPAARSLAAKEGVGDRVEFTGMLPWTKLLETYDGADFILFTSIRDAMGIQLLEAGSRGLPIIGIRHQGVGDFVPEAAGQLVALAQPRAIAEQMAAAIVRLAEDRDAYDAASAASRRFAESHSPSALVQQIVGTYRNAIAG
jgi:glycosyltransferase involved in cell wall biosynthesis